MAAAINISPESIRQLTTTQKKNALFLLARELLAEEPEMPLLVSNPLGETDEIYLIRASTFQFGPLVEVDEQTFDEETRRRAKLAEDPKNLIPLEEMIKLSAKPKKR